MVLLPLLVNVGFSEGCSNEITGILLPMVPGAVTALWGRVRAGGVSPLGFKQGDLDEM